MSSEWIETALGDVMAQVKDPVNIEPGVHYATMGIRYGIGAYSRGKAPVKASRMFRARSGQFLFSRIDTQRGAFAVVPDALDGHLVTNEFPLYEPSNGRIVPAYLLLYFRRQSILNAIDRRRAGTEGRSRWKEADFEGWRVSLPPIPTQRRIVAVIDSIDKQIAALDAERNSLAQILTSFLRVEMNSLDSRVPFGDLASTIRSGPSWAAKDETKSPAANSLRVVKITNTRPDGSIDMSDETYVKGLPPSTLVLDESSLVLIRTNGNRQRIGNVYVPRGKALGCAVSAFQFLVQVGNPDDRDFIYWALKEPAMQNRMSEAASGTTGLGNIAAGWLKTATIPWAVDAKVRSSLVDRFRAIATQIEALSGEHQRLTETRIATLNALLSREIEIPESFDEKFPEAVAG